MPRSSTTILKAAIYRNGLNVKSCADEKRRKITAKKQNKSEICCTGKIISCSTRYGFSSQTYKYRVLSLPLYWQAWRQIVSGLGKRKMPPFPLSIRYSTYISKPYYFSCWWWYSTPPINKIWNLSNFSTFFQSPLFYALASPEWLKVDPILSKHLYISKNT